MTYEEFKNHVETVKLPGGKIIQMPSDEEFGMITTVYNFHPSISETDGKPQIAELYAKYGMSIIRDMEPRAKVMQKLESDLMKCRAEEKRLKDLMEDIREGGEI